MQIIDEVDRIFSTPRDIESNSKSINKKRIQASSHHKKRHSVQNINIFQHFWKNINDDNTNNNNVSSNEMKSGSNKSKQKKFKSEKKGFYLGAPIKDVHDQFNRLNKKGSKMIEFDSHCNSKTQKFYTHQKKNKHKHKNKNQNKHNSEYSDMLHANSHNIKQFKEEMSSSGDKMLLSENGHSSSSFFNNSNNNKSYKHKLKNDDNCISAKRNHSSGFTNLFIETIQSVSDVFHWINKVKDKDKKKRLSFAILNQMSYKPVSSLNPDTKKNKHNTDSVIIEEDLNQRIIVNDLKQKDSPSVCPCNLTPVHLTPVIKNSSLNGKSEMSSDQSPNENKRSLMNPIGIEAKVKSQPSNVQSSNNIQTYTAGNYLDGITKCEFSKKKKRKGILCCLPINFNNE